MLNHVPTYLMFTALTAIYLELNIHHSLSTQELLMSMGQFAYTYDQDSQWCV